MLYKSYPKFLLIRLLGVWETAEYSQSGQQIPVSGLAYFITPPTR